MQTTNYRIPAGEEILACSVDYADKIKTPSVICLHGGRPTGRHSTEYVAKALQASGRTVIPFDFSGQGDSTGEMATSSLKKRLLETQAVLAYFGVQENLSVIGTSMGGYIACALAKEVPIGNLVLFGPAAYTRKAWKVEFGSGFTEIIREDNSFLDSDLSDLLNHFTGNALFIIGKNDEIIPRQVVELYRRALGHCAHLEEYTIVNCPHPIHRWVLKHPDIRREIEERVLRIIGQQTGSAS
ncbi:MAG TPA: alpha/beta fold hydrolase [Anaerolineaceae bacterium]|nr:alpha/beta fold hydrolase [Anaerolineaceae bacterium]